jgi:hypothetical protein
MLPAVADWARAWVFRWRRLMSEGGKEAVRADDEVVAASEVPRLEVASFCARFLEDYRILMHAGLAREAIRVRSVIVSGAEITRPKQNPRSGACIPGEPRNLGVATQSFPYIAEFCKQILATGKIGLKLPLPGRLRCNPRGRHAFNGLPPALPSRLRRAEDLCCLAGVARPHHRGGKFQPLPKKRGPCSSTITASCVSGRPYFTRLILTQMANASAYVRVVSYGFGCRKSPAALHVVLTNGAKNLAVRCPPVA